MGCPTFCHTCCTLAQGDVSNYPPGGANFGGGRGDMRDHFVKHNQKLTFTNVEEHILQTELPHFPMSGGGWAGGNGLIHHVEEHDKHCKILPAIGELLRSSANIFTGTIKPREIKEAYRLRGWLKWEIHSRTLSTLRCS